MAVRNDRISDTSYTTAKAHATIIDAGEGIEQHGHCWSTNVESITVDTENKTEKGAANAPGSYSSILTNLSPGESYYVRAYVKNGKAIVYGDDILPFTTLSMGKPVVNTGTVTKITASSAKVSATLNSLGAGASSITQHGHCWSSETITPVIEDNENKTSLGPRDSTGNFESTLVGLSPGTHYYVRAYATNVETVYGDSISFITREHIQAEFDAEPRSGDYPLGVQFTDMSTGDIDSWYWDFGDDGLSSSKNPLHTYYDPGSYTVTLTVSGEAGSVSETKHDYIIVDDPGTAPIANFTANRTTILEGETVSFTDQSLNNPTSWSWDFGDGGTSSSPNPSHQYNTEGIYSVTLTATNSYGSDDVTKNNYIIVSVSGTAPIANFTADKTSITEGETVNFTDLSTNGPTSWSWDFGDGGTSSSPNPSHQYNTEGTYSVTLTATNSYGSDDETKNNYITVSVGGSAPVANFTADKTSITEGETVYFTDLSTNGPTSWSWDFGDGGTSSSPNPSHQYNTEGIYSVTLTATNSYGSDDETKNNYITVSVGGSAPVANFTADKTSITEGETVYFTDLSTNGPTSWSWDFGDGGTSSSDNPSYQYSTEGIYSVILTVTNSHGSDTEVKIDYIVVSTSGAAPIANFTADKTSITEGETVYFTDLSTNGPTSWLWDFGDGGTSSSDNPSYQYSTEGIYSVTLTVTNSYGSDTETKSNYIKFKSQVTVIDEDGNEYNTVQIGEQIWMAENLKTTRYNDGTYIPLVTENTEWNNLTTPAYCWYNNNPSSYKDLYGALYNWYTVNTSKLCPTGWHVPSDQEWTNLENYLIANGYNFDGTTTGNKIAKSLAATTIWKSSSTIGAVGNTDYTEKRNATGFTALPGGCRYSVSGGFAVIGSYGDWWSATERTTESAYAREIAYSHNYTLRVSFKKYAGFSIRCLRD